MQLGNLSSPIAVFISFSKITGNATLFARNQFPNSTISKSTSVPCIQEDQYVLNQLYHGC